MVYFKDGRWCARFVRNKYQYYFGRYRSEHTAWEIVNKALAIYAEGGHDALMKYRQTLPLALTKTYKSPEQIDDAEVSTELTGTDIVLSHFKGGGYKSARTLVTETHLEADIVERALSVLLENGEILVENLSNSTNKLYYQKPKNKMAAEKVTETKEKVVKEKAMTIPMVKGLANQIYTQINKLIKII
jgi:hypothetical protein